MCGIACPRAFVQGRGTPPGRANVEEGLSRRMGWWRAAPLALAALGSGCSFFRPPPSSAPTQVGVASWYGPGLHGGSTASGERFDSRELTAAHPSLPLGTRARVTNLD